MKPISRIILTAVALTFAAAPMAQARDRYDAPTHRQERFEPKRPQYHAPKQTKHFAPKQHRWNRGERLNDWKRRQAVRDYHRYGLKRPAKGQQWVKVDNEFLLVTLATGIIAGIAAAH